MRTRQNTGILKALAAALLLHALVLSMPLTRPGPPPIDNTTAIELELITYLSAPPVAETEPEPVVSPDTSPGPLPDVEDSMAQAPAEPHHATPDPAPLIVKRAVTEQVTHDPTAIILSRQFITEVPAVDRLFGKPLATEDPATNRGFRSPVRPGLLTMLDKPLPDLPFAYTPGLVHFAYAPGVRGDLQRFWDVITPEFGWRTDNGTEIRCIWAIVIMGCGWK